MLSCLLLRVCDGCRFRENASHAIEWEEECRQMERSPAVHALGIVGYSLGLEEEQSVLAS